MAPKDRDKERHRRESRKRESSWGERPSRRGDRRSRSRSRSRSRRRSDKRSPRRIESRHRDSRDPPVTRRLVDKAPEEGELLCDFQPLVREPPPPGEAHPVPPSSWDAPRHLSNTVGHSHQAFGACWTDSQNAREVTPPPHMDTFGRDESASIPPPQPPSHPPPLPKDAPPPLPSDPPPEDDSLLVPPPPPPGDPPACLPQPAAYPASTQLPIPAPVGYDLGGWQHRSDHGAYAHPEGYNYPPTQSHFHRRPPHEQQQRRWSYHDNRGTNWGHGKHHNRHNQQRGHRQDGMQQNHNRRFSTQRGYNNQHHDFRHDRSKNQNPLHQDQNNHWGVQQGGWPPDHGRRTDACRAETISRMNKDIIEKGMKWLAERWGVEKKEDKEGGETLKSRVADLMLKTMYKENDSDYGCSDSEDEHGRRLKPRRITRRMLCRAWEEIRSRRSSHAQWYKFAKSKGVILKPFPIVPADDTKLPQVVEFQPTGKPDKRRRPREIPWHVGRDEKNAETGRVDPRLVIKTENENGTGRSEALPDSGESNGGSVEDRMDTQVHIPNLALIKYLKASDRRHKATYKLQYYSRIHGTCPPNAPRENPEGSNKFNYLNSRAEFSTSTYTLAKAHDLTTRVLGNGRRMTFPNSVVNRRDDDLWLHVRECPYHPLELCDRLITGRPLFSEGTLGKWETTGDHVEVKLYLNTGPDADSTPILVHIAVHLKKAVSSEALPSKLRSVSGHSAHPPAGYSMPKERGRKRSLDTADNHRAAPSEKMSAAPCNTGTAKEEERKPKSVGVVHIEEVDESHRKKRTRHTAPSASPTLNTASVVKKPGSQNPSGVLSGGVGVENQNPCRASNLRLPVVVDVEPGSQHVARVAGMVGMKGVRRVIHSDLSQRLIKSAVQRILADEWQRAEVAKCAKPKSKPPPASRQSPLGVGVTVHTKNRGTPVRTPGNASGSGGGSSAGRGPTTPVRGRGRGGRVMAGRGAAPGRGRGRGRGQVASRGRGRGRQAPERKDQFAVDGASVTEWITSCILRGRQQ